jgi:hypothetical protein
MAVKSPPINGNKGLAWLQASGIYRNALNYPSRLSAHKLSVRRFKNLIYRPRSQVIALLVKVL